MNSYKTDAEKNGATIILATAIHELNKRSVQANHKSIGDTLETTPNNLSPSSIHFWREALDKLLNESMIAKIAVERDFGNATQTYKLLRPIEEIEAYFKDYKWDKRTRKTKEKKEPFENSVDIRTVLKKLNLKQYELAEKVGLDGSTISKIKYGHSPMPEELKMKLLTLLSSKKEVTSYSRVKSPLDFSVPGLRTPTLKEGWEKTKRIEKLDNAKSIVIQIKDVTITIQL